METATGSSPLLVHDHWVVVGVARYRGAFPLLLVGYHVLVGSGSHDLLPLVERVGSLQDPEHATLSSLVAR